MDEVDRKELFMMEGYELQKEINTKLNSTMILYRNRGQTLAESERDYRVALAKKILLLRDDKVPVTIINDLARGDEAVADLKFKRDVAQTLYDSVTQAIFTLRLQLKIARAEVSEDRKGYGDD